jgi:hypothetical protein
MGPVDEVAPRAGRLARRRTLLLTCGLSALATIVIGVVLVERTPGSSAKAQGSVHTPVTVPAALRLPEPSHPRATAPETSARPPTTRPPVTTAGEPPSVTTPDTLVSTPGTDPSPTTTSSEPVATPTTLLAPAITVTLPPPPPPFGASVLTWTAPTSIDIAAGASASLTVRAHNPTGRAVSLDHPLACTPRLDHSEVCADVVQSIPAGASVTVRYTIDAAGFAPGKYTLRIEGVLTVAVTVSPPTPA